MARSVFRDKFLDEHWFLQIMVRRKRQRTKTGSRSPSALWIIVDISKEDDEPLLDSKSTMAHQVLGDNILRRSTSPAEINEGEDVRKMSSLSEPTLCAMCLHSEETNASPPWKGITDCIRIILLNYDNINYVCVLLGW